jgi:hypothetical protein
MSNVPKQNRRYVVILWMILLSAMCMLAISFSSTNQTDIASYVTMFDHAISASSSSSSSFFVNQITHTQDHLQVSLAQHYKILRRKDEEILFSFHQGESFSACIIIKDENHRLSECWLAYHYFALPLRTLLVLVDPTSTQSPEPILDLWRSHSTFRNCYQCRAMLTLRLKRLRFHLPRPCCQGVCGRDACQQ